MLDDLLIDHQKTFGSKLNAYLLSASYLKMNSYRSVNFESKFSCSHLNQKTNEIVFDFRPKDLE